MTPEKLAEVEARLMADIRWAIEQGPGWDPDSGAWFNPDNQQWESNQRSCGVCAVGAHVVRNCQNYEPDDEYDPPDDVDVAATSLGVSEGWLRELYYQVAGLNGFRYDYQETAELARRLLAFAGQVQAEKAARG